MDQVPWRALAVGAGTAGVVLASHWAISRWRTTSSTAQRQVANIAAIPDIIEALEAAKGQADAKETKASLGQAIELLRSHSVPRSGDENDDKVPAYQALPLVRHQTTPQPCGSPVPSILPLQRQTSCPPVIKYTEFKPDFDALTSSDRSPHHVADSFCSEGIFALEFCETAEQAELSPQQLERQTSEAEWEDAWERMADSLPTVREFKDYFEVQAEDHVIPVGRVYYDRPAVSAVEGDIELRRLGFNKFIGFKSLAFCIGEDRELVVCALSEGHADKEKLVRMHQSLKPQISEDLKSRYMELNRQAPPPMDKSKGKPSQEMIEIMRAHRLQKRALEDEATSSLRDSGATSQYVERQIAALRTGQDPLRTKIEFAPEELMTTLTGCVRGGLHPIRHCYRDQTIPVFVDRASFNGVLNKADDYRWAVVGGGTPLSVFFIPLNAFRSYVEDSAILGDILA